MPLKVIVMQESAPVLCRGIWKSSQWLFSKHLMWFIMLWDRITDVKETYYIITSVFIRDQVIFPQQRMHRVLDSRYICSPTTFQTWQEKHHPESSLKRIKRDRESRLPCPSILKILCGFLCYAFSDFFNSHLTVLSVLRHLCRCVARESYAEPYPGCMGISEEVKLQSISLELIGMTYSGAGVGRDLLYYLSLVRIDHTEFRLCHLCEVVAINSVLQLKSFLFFSYSLPFSIPPLPPQAAKGSFHLHRTSQLLKGEQQIWPAGSIKMITPPSSGQIQLNRHCTSMTRKVNRFLISWFCIIFSKKGMIKTISL